MQILSKDMEKDPRQHKVQNRNVRRLNDAFKTFF